MSIITPSLNQIDLQMSECMSMLKFFDAVRKTAVIPLVSINFSQTYSQDFQLDLLHYHIKFHPDQTNSVGKKSSHLVFLRTDLVTPRQGQGQ